MSRIQPPINDSSFVRAVIPWTAWYPTITAPGGTPPTYTYAQTGKYCQIGKIVIASFALQNTSGGTAGSGAVDIISSIPVTAAMTEATDNVIPIGSVHVYNGAGLDYRQPFLASTTTMKFRNISTANLTAVEQNNNVRMIFCEFTYEAA